jgi:hypothetical protein
VDVSNLSGLTQTDLNTYLWRRLRLEDPMDPPLDRRFRMEPPEDIFLRAARLEGDASPFHARLVQAIEENLRRSVRAAGGGPLDDQDNEQLASLAFLAAGLKAHELHQAFYKAALYADAAEGVAEGTYFHLLRTLAMLQQGTSLIPFWEGLLQDSRPEIRAIAYFGLARADTDRLLRRLSTLLDDRALDLPPIIWHLAAETPGAAALGRAARHLSSPQHTRLLEALKEGGADHDMLRDYKVQESTAAAGFRFPVAEPRDPRAAKRKPSWSPRPELQRAA